MRRVVLALLLLAACGGSSGGSASLSSAGPTTAQAASVVAAHGPTLRAKIASDIDCRSGDCLIPDNLFRRWEGIKNEVAALFDGMQAVKPFPAEVNELATRTVQQLSDTVQAFSTWGTCLGTHHLMADCASQQDAYETAFRALPALLDAWKPFGA